MNKTLMWNVTFLILKFKIPEKENLYRNWLKWLLVSAQDEKTRH